MVVFLLSTPAFALDLDVGGGLRNVSTTFDGAPLGAHVMGRLGVHPNVAIELGGFVRFPGDDVKGLATTLILIAHDTGSSTFQVPIRREVGAVDLLAELSPWARREGDKVSAWVYGAAGLTLRTLNEDTATLNETFGSDPTASPVSLTGGGTTIFVPGPAAGLGFDLWFYDRVGARLLWLGRAGFEQELDYGNMLPDGTPAPLETVLAFSSALTFDLMVSF